MKFVWVPSINRFRRTETETKKERLKYEVVEFETDKDSLIERFNAYEERIEALENQLRGATSPQPAADEPLEPAPTVSPPQPVPVAPPAEDPALKRQLAQQFRQMETDEIVDRIFAAKPNDMAHFLLASVGRLGELGREGWEYVQAHRNFTRDCERNQAKEKRPYAAAFDEKGLRYLCLMLIEDMNGQKVQG
jgi:hypothetical protein